MIYYVYCHFRDDTKDVFYVGKGQGCRRNKTHGRSKFWKNIVKKSGGFYSEIIAQNLTEEEAFSFEKLLILKLKEEGAKLCNLTDGGDGVSGHRHTKETREKISTALKGRVSHNKGKKASLESRQKMRQAKLGVKQSPEHIAASALSRTGRPCSEETKRKISEHHKGKKLPYEHFKNIRKLVFCVTNETTYPSVTEAAEVLGLSTSNISRCCQGKFKQTGGYQFKYLTEE